MCVQNPLIHTHCLSKFTDSRTLGLTQEVHVNLLERFWYTNIKKMFYCIEELMLFLYICAYRWVLTYLFYSRWKWCILLPSCEWSRTASVARVHYLFVHMHFYGSTTRNNSCYSTAVDDAVWGGLEFRVPSLEHYLLWRLSLSFLGASHRPWP